MGCASPVSDTDEYVVYTHAQRPDLAHHCGSLGDQWATFMHHEAASQPHYSEMKAIYSHLCFYVCETATHERERVVMQVQAMGLHWDGSRADLPTGWTDAVRRSVDEHHAHVAPNTLCGLSVTIAATHQGQGLGAEALQLMRDLAAHEQYQQLIVPVRPSQKADYPLIPMRDYLTWQRDDGLAYDNWLRVHQRCGADIADVAEKSLVVRGSVAEWEQWTGKPFPESGHYVVAGALCPVQIDCERDVGVYVEPNVWVVHPPLTSEG